MSTPHLVTLLFGSFLVYTVAIFVVIPHSFVTLHHHELVRPRLGRDFPQEILDEALPWAQYFALHIRRPLGWLSALLYKDLKNVSFADVTMKDLAIGA